VKASGRMSKKRWSSSGFSATGYAYYSDYNNGTRYNTL